MQSVAWMRTFGRRMRRRMRYASQAVQDRLHGRWVQMRLAQAYPIQASEETIGAYGERLASVYLERCGYTLLERSFRTRFGEIDLIAAWGKRIVVFVEVKTWAGEWFNAGGPADAVDETKQRKITQTALVYLKRHSLLDTSSRMDVIEVTFDGETRHPKFRHFENAFEATGKYQMHT